MFWLLVMMYPPEFRLLKVSLISIALAAGFAQSFRRRLSYLDAVDTLLRNFLVSSDHDFFDILYVQKKTLGSFMYI